MRKVLGDDLLLHGLSHTTIGAGAFHFRVRDGIGWFHTAIVTGQAVVAALGSAREHRGDVAGGEGPAIDASSRLEVKRLEVIWSSRTDH